MKRLLKRKEKLVQFWLTPEQHKRLKKYGDWLGTRPNDAARQAMIAIVLLLLISKLIANMVKKRIIKN